LRRPPHPNLFGSNVLRSELVAVASEVGRVSFRAPVFAGAPGLPDPLGSPVTAPVGGRKPHIGRAAFALLVPIGCGATVATLLVNHLEADHGSAPAAAAPPVVTPTPAPDPAPTLQRKVRSTEKRPSERRQPAQPAPLQHTPARANTRATTQGHATARTRSLLRWRPVAGAAHYHFALWRNGTRVLDLWPARPSVAVPHEWVHNGTRYRTQPGKYLWLVYPGDGPKARGHYGPLVAAGVLVIPSHKGVQG
jgi:hypothetical protein